jgi:hypothetical protein
LGFTLRQTILLIIGKVTLTLDSMYAQLKPITEVPKSREIPPLAEEQDPLLNTYMSRGGQKNLGRESRGGSKQKIIVMARTISNLTDQSFLKELNKFVVKMWFELPTFRMRIFCACFCDHDKEYARL